MSEIWVVFRGQLTVEGTRPDNFSDIDQVVEVVKAEKISKSYAKLIETPFYHPNVSYGDIIRVVPSNKELDDRVAVIEFSGVFSEDSEEEDVEGLGSAIVQIDPKDVEKISNIDKQVKPVILDKYKQGLVYEPVELISHGTYKINISYEVEKSSDLNSMKEYFSTYDAIFHASWNKKFGSVGFSKETKFERAVRCLEDAPNVLGCFIAFNPKEFPSIDFSEDLIPRKEEEEEGF
jgi:hypothetical protein